VGKAMLGSALLVGGLMAAAGAEAGPRSVGLGAGQVDPQGLGAALWLTANLRWAAGHNVVVEPEAGYWKKEESSPAGTGSVEDLGGGVNVLYRFRPKRPLGFFAGAGAGLHYIRSSFTLGDTLKVSDNQLKQGFHLLAGVEYALSGSVTLFAEVRHDLVADLDQSKAAAGIRFGI